MITTRSVLTRTATATVLAVGVLLAVPASGQAAGGHAEGKGGRGGGGAGRAQPAVLESRRAPEVEGELGGDREDEAEPVESDPRE